MTFWSILFIFAPLGLFAEIPNFQEVRMIDQSILETRCELQKKSSNHLEVLKLFDDLSAEWKAYSIQKNGFFDLSTLLKAVSFAALKHEGEVRKDFLATPYIIHPLEVTHSLWKEGKIRSVNVLTAAILHDTLEDTDATSEEIEKLFGPRIRSTVEELTNDPNLTTHENKQRQVEHAPYLSLDAQLIKLADRLANIRDLKNPPLNWTKEMVHNYLNWGKKLVKALSGTHEQLEKALEEEIARQLSITSL